MRPERRILTQRVPTPPVVSRSDTVRRITNSTPPAEPAGRTRRKNPPADPAGRTCRHTPPAEPTDNLTGRCYCALLNITGLCVGSAGGASAPEATIVPKTRRVVGSEGPTPPVVSRSGT